MKEHAEALEAVANIQSDVYEKTFENISLAYTTNGAEGLIEFCGNVIWSSEGDERDTDEKTGDFEPLERFLRKMISVEIARMTEISDACFKFADEPGVTGC